MTTTASADQVFSDDVIITGNTCIGADCVDGEGFSGSFDGQLRLKGQFNAIEFQDTSGPSDADRDWRLRANLNSGGSIGESFFLEDITEGTTPFWIEGGAPSNAFYLDNRGYVGIGTSLPNAELHVIGTANAELRLESTDFNGSDWVINSNRFNMQFQNKKNGRSVLYIDRNAEFGTLTLFNNGQVGINTTTPDAPLEVASDASFSYLRLTADQASINQSVDITFTGGPLGTGQLRYNIVDGDNQEMSLDADGNVVIDGTLTTAGPTCAGGCDRVFDEGYALPSITNHAQQMFDLGYLPSIGATVPHAPVNVTEKLGNTINSLEHAHIFIAQQQEVIAQQSQVLTEVLARLNALEAQ